MHFRILGKYRLFQLESCLCFFVIWVFFECSDFDLWIRVPLLHLRSKQLLGATILKRRATKGYFTQARCAVYQIHTSYCHLWRDLRWNLSNYHVVQTATFQTRNQVTVAGTRDQQHNEALPKTIPPKNVCTTMHVPAPARSCWHLWHLWKLLRTYLETCASIVQAVVCRPPCWCLDEISHPTLFAREIRLNPR